MPGRLAAKEDEKQTLDVTSALQLAGLCVICYPTYLYVLGSIIGEPFIHLVTEAQQIVLNTQIGNHLELFCLVNL